MDSSYVEVKLEVLDEELNSIEDEDVRPESETVHSILDKTMQIESNQNQSKQRAEIELNNVTSINITKRFQCTRCPKSYSWKTDLNKHMKDLHVEDRDKSFQCEICLSQKICRKFIDERSLNEHTKNAHGNFECKYCFKKLSGKRSLKAHYRNMHSEKPFKCEFCSMCFTRQPYLNGHLLAKHKDVAKECKNMKSHKCDICSKEFYYSFALVRHVLQVHVVDNKTFKCQYCSKTFMNERPLAAHVKLHEDKKCGLITQFPCDVCPSRFNCSIDLMSHFQDKHNRFFYCSKCLKSFEIESELELHLKTVEETENEIYTGPKLQCEICNEFFKSHCSLKIHTNSHLNKIKPEPMEEKQSKHSNTEDQSDDELQCDLCFKSFNNASNLGFHRKNAHANAEWKCKVCSKKFKQRNRMRYHQKDCQPTKKSYKCDKCQNCFDCQDTFNTHKKMHLDAEEEEVQWKNIKTYPRPAKIETSAM